MKEITSTTVVLVCGHSCVTAAEISRAATTLTTVSQPTAPSQVRSVGRSCPRRPMVARPTTMVEVPYLAPYTVKIPSPIVQIAARRMAREALPEIQAEERQKAADDKAIDIKRATEPDPKKPARRPASLAFRNDINSVGLNLELFVGKFHRDAGLSHVPDPLRTVQARLRSRSAQAETNRRVTCLASSLVPVPNRYLR